MSSCLPAWIESYQLFLFQEINQGHRDEPLRTWGEYDGNHTRLQDKLHQVMNLDSYSMTSRFYFINLFREFLECIPDVIFFQDCIQEEDITSVLNQVSRNGYKIHFQVSVWEFLIQNQVLSISRRNFPRRRRRAKKAEVPEEGEMLRKRRGEGEGRRMLSRLPKPPLQLPGSLTSILERRFRWQQLIVWL